MSPEKLNKKLAEAGCVITSTGSIDVDLQRLLLAFLAALEEIERLEVEVQAMGSAQTTVAA